MWLFIGDKKKLKCFKYGTTNDFCALSLCGYGYRVSNIFPIQIIITFQLSFPYTETLNPISSVEILRYFYHLNE